jgi:hypothetical protein
LPPPPLLVSSTYQPPLSGSQLHNHSMKKGLTESGRKLGTKIGILVRFGRGRGC